MHTCYLDSNLFYVGWLFLSGTGNFYTILRPNKHRRHPEETSNHITYTSNKLLKRMTKKTQQHPTPPLWQVAHDVIHLFSFLLLPVWLIWCDVFWPSGEQICHIHSEQLEMNSRWGKNKKNREKRRIKILRSNVCYCSGATLCFL